MPQRAPKPDAFSYNAAMSACDAACNWQRTIELLERALQCGLEPGGSSYSSATCACAAGALRRRAPGATDLGGSTALHGAVGV